MVIGLISLEQSAILLGVGALAGVIESTAGGSGLVVLPTLVMLGFPPIEAMATSKFQYLFGALVAIKRFSSAGLVGWRALAPLMLVALIAGAAGASALTILNAELIATLMPLLLISAALYFAFSPSLTDQDRLPRVGTLTMALLPIPVIAFYDGFFGVGSASLYMMALVTLRGYNIKRATASTKLVDCASGAAALLVLALGGHVLLIPGLALALGQILGAYFGAGLVLKWGAKWIRPMLVLITIALSATLLAQHHEYLIVIIRKLLGE